MESVPGGVAGGGAGGVAGCRKGRINMTSVRLLCTSAFVINGSGQPPSSQVGAPFTREFSTIAPLLDSRTFFIFKSVPPDLLLNSGKVNGNPAVFHSLPPPPP